MDKRSKELYLEAIGKALALATGQRNEDYNKGGIDLRSYWEVNGIKSPLQMVDMKVKRALSQVGTWPTEPKGLPCPTEGKQVDAILESMADAINYAAFTFCEAASLLEEHMKGTTVDTSHGEALTKMLKDGATNAD